MVFILISGTRASETLGIFLSERDERSALGYVQKAPFSHTWVCSHVVTLGGRQLVSRKTNPVVKVLDLLAKPWTSREGRRAGDQVHEQQALI